MPLPADFSLLAFFISVVPAFILGVVLSRLLFLVELLCGIFLFIKFSLTKLPGILLPEVCEAGFPLLLPTDCDLLLKESALLPLCRRLEISLMLVFFLDWSISVCICFILACTFRSLFLDATMFRFRVSIYFTCF